MENMKDVAKVAAEKLTALFERWGLGKKTAAAVSVGLVAVIVYLLSGCAGGRLVYEHPDYGRVIVSRNAK